MENREAIKIISNYEVNGCGYCHQGGNEVADAFDLAIAALEKQERETQEKPFPFVVGQPAEMFFDGKWVKGKIVAGYRFSDGVVTIETEDGRRIWCGQDRTDIYRPYQEDKA